MTPRHCIVFVRLSISRTQIADAVVAPVAITVINLGRLCGIDHLENDPVNHPDMTRKAHHHVASAGTGNCPSGVLGVPRSERLRILEILSWTRAPTKDASCLVVVEETKQQITRRQ